MTASRADRIEAQETRLAADDSVTARAEGVRRVARIYLDAGATPDVVRVIAVRFGPRYLFEELAGAMEQLLSPETAPR